MFSAFFNSQTKQLYSKKEYIALLRNMAEGETSRKRLHHFHVDLEQHYAPILKRQKSVQQSIEQRDMMRKGGLQHIDLWCDGSIYPTWLIKNSTPPFSNPTTLLKFVVDGINGLYGYVSAQCTNANIHKSLYLQEEEIRRQDKIECVALKQLLENEKEEYKKTKVMLLKARRKSTVLGDRLRNRKIRNIVELKAGSGSCKRQNSKSKVWRYLIVNFYSWASTNLSTCMLISLMYPNCSNERGSSKFFDFID